MKDKEKWLFGMQKPAPARGAPLHLLVRGSSKKFVNREWKRVRAWMDQELDDLKHWRFQMPRRSEALDVGVSAGHSPKFITFIGAEFVCPQHQSPSPPSLTLHNHLPRGRLFKRQGGRGKGSKRKKIKSPGTKYMQNLFSNEGLIGLPLKSGYVKNCPFHS